MSSLKIKTSSPTAATAAPTALISSRISVGSESLMVKVILCACCFVLENWSSFKTKLQLHFLDLAIFRGNYIFCAWGLFSMYCGSSAVLLCGMFFLVAVPKTSVQNFLEFILLTRGYSLTGKTLSYQTHLTD